MSKEENINEPEREPDLREYSGESGVSLKLMNIGLWVADHRRRIFKGVIIFMISLSVFFFIYSGYGYVKYYLAGDPNANQINNNLVIPRVETIDLEAGQMKVLSSNGHTDLLVEVFNANDKYTASFNYCFKQTGADIFCGEAFIFPGEKKFVMALAQEVTGSRSELSFVIVDTTWRRLDAHLIPNWTYFFNQRLDFAVMDVSFESGTASGLSDKLNLNTLDFSIKNQTAYGYYEAPLNIFLYSGTEVVAVNHYLLNNFLPGETRSVKMSWPGSFGSVNRTDVIPDINIMDDTVYLKYQGSAVQ